MAGGGRPRWRADTELSNRTAFLGDRLARDEPVPADNPVLVVTLDVWAHLRPGATELAVELPTVVHDLFGQNAGVGKEATTVMIGAVLGIVSNRVSTSVPPTVLAASKCGQCLTR
jgi:hypothetical protein